MKEIKKEDRSSQVLSRDARFCTLLVTLSSTDRSRAALELENLVLHHQIGVQRRSSKRPKLTPVDRLLWAWLSHIWSDRRSALAMVQPETVRVLSARALVRIVGNSYKCRSFRHGDLGSWVQPHAGWMTKCPQMGIYLTPVTTTSCGFQNIRLCRAF